MKIRNIGIAAILLIVLSMAVFAQSSHEDFSEAKTIISQKTPYSQLTDDQFEQLGDYFMELMAGDNHDYMDRMMGGEGSDSLRQYHITMGKNFYQEYLDTGTLQSQGMMGGGTANYGMMGTPYYGTGNNMMGGSGWVATSFAWLAYIAIAAFVFGMVFWGTKRLMTKNDKKRR